MSATSPPSLSLKVKVVLVDLCDVNPVLIAPLLIALGVTLYMAKKQRAASASGKEKSKPAKAKAAKVKPAKAKPAKVKTPKFKRSKGVPAEEPVPAMAGAGAAPVSAPAPQRLVAHAQRRGSVL